MAATTGAVMTAAQIQAKIEELELRAGREKAALDATRAQIKAWRREYSRLQDLEARRQVQGEEEPGAKRAKKEPPPSDSEKMEPEVDEESDGGEDDTTSSSESEAPDAGPVLPQAVVGPVVVNDDDGRPAVVAAPGLAAPLRP